MKNLVYVTKGKIKKMYLVLTDKALNVLSVEYLTEYDFTKAKQRKIYTDFSSANSTIDQYETTTPIKEIDNLKQIMKEGN